MNSSSGRPGNSERATRPLPVVWPCKPKYPRISSSDNAPGRSILLPRIRTGQLASCSSVNKLCGWRARQPVSVRGTGTHVQLLLRFRHAFAIEGVDQEDDGVDGREVVLPDTTCLVMASQVEGRELHLPDTQFL